MTDFAETICTCGHWYEEHNDDLPSCAGCDAGYGESVNDPDLDLHAFQYDAESSTPDAIADRGGNPDLWPQRVKDYFAQKQLCWLDDNGYGDVDYSQSSRPQQEEAEECARLRGGDACQRHSEPEAFA